MSDKDGFDWIPFYEELANELVAYRARQKELIDFLQQLRAQGLTITPLDDEDCVLRGKAITSPKSSRSVVRVDADHHSGLMPISDSI